MNFSIFDQITENLKSEVLESKVTLSILELKLSKDKLIQIVTHLKENYQFDLFLDVTAVDYLYKKPERFDVVYHLYSTKHFIGVRLKVALHENNLEIDTLKNLYGSAPFMERECHEMYGIKFKGNSDLRPILLYGGFVGYPLRKDYPIDREQPLVPYIK